ncbi:MAG: maleylpyruvate isomerase family mycothiol-dependent enzyme [Acidimicrobiia bacterium]|nr:maleylpyruvate isomerase family mycothiol-dependent enzyme [Acidimicrobiia bacterium]
MRPAAALLLAEAEALPVVLDRYTADDLDADTLLAGWRVRDVIAHCAAALGHLVAGDELVFTPEANQVDVDARADLAVADLIAELFHVYPVAAELIDRADGLADGLALGEWVHGGDIRDALGEVDAYASAGVELALPLLMARSRERQGPAVAVSLADGELEFGVGESAGSLRTDAATLVRLCAGRRPDPACYTLHGVDPAALVLFT